MVYYGVSRSISVYIGISWYILVYNGLSQSILVYIQLYTSILAYFGLSRSISIHLCLSWSILVYLYTCNVESTAKTKMVAWGFQNGQRGLGMSLNNFCKISFMIWLNVLWEKVTLKNIIVSINVDDSQPLEGRLSATFMGTTLFLGYSPFVRSFQFWVIFIFVFILLFKIHCLGCLHMCVSILFFPSNILSIFILQRAES